MAHIKVMQEKRKMTDANALLNSSMLELFASDGRKEFNNRTEAVAKIAAKTPLPASTVP